MSRVLRQSVSFLTKPSGIRRLSMVSLALLSLIKRSCSHAEGFHSLPRIVASSAFTTAASKDDSTLAHEEDKYDGVIVNVDTLPSEVHDFTSKLTHSLNTWKDNHKRGIWLKLPIDKVAFVEPAVKLGFVYHHAEKDYVMLTNWLSDQENKMPPSATHQLGVGCVVFNKKGEMLLVQERSGLLRGTGVWKMPTGLADESEDISEAAEREIFEETGIKAKFKSILCFRQAHQIMFGKSDLFVVCVLELDDEQNTDITIQHSELVACEWLQPEAYFTQPFFQRSGVHSKINQLLQQYIRNNKNQKASETDSTASTTSATDTNAVTSSISIAETQTVKKAPSIVMSKLLTGFRPGKQTLYFVDHGEEESNT